MEYVRVRRAGADGDADGGGRVGDAVCVCGEYDEGDGPGGELEAVYERCAGESGEGGGAESGVRAGGQRGDEFRDDVLRTTWRGI